MCEIVYSDDFQGLWEEWETNRFIVGLPCFPSGRHFHRGRGDRFFVIGPVNLTGALLISVLGAVGHHCGQVLDVLLRFHHRECMAQPLVLDDGCMTYALILA